MRKESKLGLAWHPRLVSLSSEILGQKISLSIFYCTTDIIPFRVRKIPSNKKTL